MKFKNLIQLLPVLLCAYSFCTAQEKCPIKFGKVTVADFDLSKQKFDTTANAVVIADVGRSTFEGNVKGWFSLLFKKQTRIKIINKNGLDAANIEIPYYISSTGNSEERIENLKAYTYNLEGDKVIETKLENDQVFKDKHSKNWFVKKFTLPAVKEGSIIEISYTIKSDFLQNLREWEFQSEYPHLWSEYEVGMPEFFNYVFLSQGSSAFYINKKEQSSSSYNITENNGAAAAEHYNITGMVTYNRWVMKDMPALKEESYTTTIKNHIAKIEFQLSQYRFPNSPVKDIMSSWPKIAEEMMSHEMFGEALNKNNNWLDDDVKVITIGSSNNLEKAHRIFEYVRNNFTCTSTVGMYLSDNLKSIFKTKKGNVADINLLLVTMLKHEGIDASPVLLSTRNHGYTHDFYPLLDRYNYVVAEATIDGKAYYMDASEADIGFNRLPIACYNGHAWLLQKKNAVPVYFEADSLKERKVTVVFIGSNDKGEMEGNFQTTLGYYESLKFRDEIKEKGSDEYFKKLQTSYGTDFTLKNFIVDSLKLLDMPVKQSYELKLNNWNEDVIYFNPLMATAQQNNPFASATRLYPVEMPYTSDETFVLNMEIPTGYEVDEIPKSAKVLLNEDDGFFEYIINKSATQVMMRSRIVLKKANFFPDDYETLREFFGYVVKKHAEQVVLKKKKA
jgi:Transglutaminase-like superfamily/Domain of Unknown Function with PDB structure (DUF3857)